MTDIGICFDRTFAPSVLPDYARRVESGGIDQLWLIEDCFFTAGVSLAATALAATERTTVGIGILPAVARHPAVTAMEIATLCDLAPDRFVPGIGHGVQEWMAQMGVRPASPVTALDETLTIVRRLLAGEELSFDGRYWQLDRVRLDRPPADPPPLLAGVRRARSLAVAGRSADGVILAEGAGPTYVSWALEQAGREADQPFHVATFAILSIADDRRDAYGPVAPLVADLLAEGNAAMRVLPWYDDARRRVADGGADALLAMPVEFWREIGLIGTMGDALAHVDAMAAVGVDVVNAFPAPMLDVAREQIDQVTELARSRR